MLSRSLATALAIALITTAPAAQAYEPTLSSAEITSAVAAGAEMDAAHRGYNAGSNVVYALADTLELKPGGPVEAIIAGSPYERLRYNAYLEHFQETPLSSVQARTLEARLAYHLRVIIFAHSRDAKDADFLDRFRNLTLAFGGIKIPGNRVDHMGPELDFYSTKIGWRVERYVGNVTFAFDLRPLERARIDLRAAKAMLSFVDSAGNVERYPLNFEHFR